MKLSAATFSLCLFVGSTTAQYFSVGWSPGQKASADKPPAPQASSTLTTAAAAAEKTPSSIPNSFIEKVLSSGPAAALLSTLGVNISAATNVKLWDERIELITDDNYQDVIVNEHLSPNEEKERAWVVVITGQAVKQDEISKLADNVFDIAYEQSLQGGDLPHIRWGRIDYLNVTRITTKWGIWQVPYIVIITDRGQTLRFYRHYQVRWRAENLREFLKTREYLLTPPWATAYAPGGEREYILDHFASILTKIYDFTILFPRWLLVVASGGIASLVIGLMHRSSNKSDVPKSKSTATAAEEKPKPSTASTPATISPSTVPTKATNIQSNGTASTPAAASKPASKPGPTDTPKPTRAGSLPKSASKTLTPTATDSERESTAKPTKRPARAKKSKKT